MSRQFVSKGYVELNGVPIVYAAGLDIQAATNITDVDTIIDEMGGFAQGTSKYDVDITSPVPAEGFEVDFFTLARAGQIHEFRFVVLKPNGGIAHARLLRGMFMDPGLSIGANKAADLKVKFRGMEVESL